MCFERCSLFWYYKPFWPPITWHFQRLWINLSTLSYTYNHECLKSLDDMGLQFVTFELVRTKNETGPLEIWTKSFAIKKLLSFCPSHTGTQVSNLHVSHHKVFPESTALHSQGILFSFQLKYISDQFTNACSSACTVLSLMYLFCLPGNYSSCRNNRPPFPAVYFARLKRTNFCYPVME